MCLKLSFLCFFLAGFLFIAPAAAQNSGFTAGVGLGLGHQVVSVDDTSDSKNGLGGPSLKLGGFVQPNLAILLKVAGTMTFESEQDVDLTFSHFLVGPAVQFWPTESVFLEAGVGYSRVGITVKSGGRSLSDSDEGVGLMGALGFMFFRQGAHALGVSLDLAGGSHDRFNFYSTAVLFNWQVL